MISLNTQKEATLTIGNKMLRNLKLIALEHELPVSLIIRLSKLGCGSFLDRNTVECANWSIIVKWCKLRVVTD